MKILPCLLLLLTLSIVSAAPDPDALVKLRKAWENSLSDADRRAKDLYKSKTLAANKLYYEELQEMKKNFMTDQNLQAAVAVDNEIKKLVALHGKQKFEPPKPPKKTPPKPPKKTEAGGGKNATTVVITPSELDPSKSQTREKACESWIPTTESQARFDEFLKQRKFPIWTEYLSSKEGGKQRSIYIVRPDGVGFWWRLMMKEGQLLDFNSQYIREGFVLLTLYTHNFSYGKRHAALWVNKSSEKKMLGILEQYGISQGVIKIN